MKLNTSKTQNKRPEKFPTPSVCHVPQNSRHEMNRTTDINEQDIFHFTKMWYYGKGRLVLNCLIKAIKVKSFPVDLTMKLLNLFWFVACQAIWCRDLRAVHSNKADVLLLSFVSMETLEETCCTIGTVKDNKSYKKYLCSSVHFRHATNTAS